MTPFNPRKEIEEYKLTEAGAFNEKDLLEFIEAEQEKGRTVRKIWITRLQANHLVNSVEGVKPKLTGKKLVDFWNAPKTPIKLKTIHGVEVGIEDWA